VKILSFNAVYNKQQVNVTWDVNSQVNVRRYELESRTDFNGYKKVAELVAVDGKSVYHAMHSSPTKGNNYYRLKAVDEDGKFDYSEERVVKILEDQAAIIYPNPASKNVTVKLGYTPANAKLTLINAMGMKLYHTSIKGTSTYDFSVDSFAPGVYFVRITEINKPTVSLPLIITH
ncbi:MAG: T9SS type A sorting domain-containing protein, partial [Flavobacterium sp.]